MTVVLVRYYAAARDASGVDEERVSAGNVAELVTVMTDRHGGSLGRVLTACSFLLNGVAVTDTAQLLNGDAQVDVLPPFAGG